MNEEQFLKRMRRLALTVMALSNLITVGVIFVLVTGQKTELTVVICSIFVALNIFLNFLWIGVYRNP